jgi:Zn-finger nucleic acid-binding protein
MEKVTFNNVEVDRCLHCGGMWFDLLEHEALKNMQGSEAIDTGSHSVGKQYNKVDKIVCPVCNTDMIRMVDKDHHHLWYEACGTCYGVFFDAGEFRDFKKGGITGFIKDLLTPERV